MTKKLFTYSILAIAFVFFFASCENESYATKRNREKKDWENYVKARGLEFSTDSAYCFSQPVPWPENFYFETPRGAYMRLIKNDITKRQPKAGNTIIYRFQSFDLNGNLMGDNTSASSAREGYVFVYKPGSESPSIAFVDVTGYIHNDTEFEILVPSKVGPSEQYQEVITLRMLITSTKVQN